MVLRQTLKRSGDVAFRLGGEEFGVTVTVRNGEDALMIGERLRKGVEDLHILHEKNDQKQHVTVSCGLMVVFTSSDSENDLEDIYRKADLALYQAKEGGRNRVVVYTE